MSDCWSEKVLQSTRWPAIMELWMNFSEASQWLPWLAQPVLILVNISLPSLPPITSASLKTDALKCLSNRTRNIWGLPTITSCDTNNQPSFWCSMLSCLFQCKHHNAMPILKIISTRFEFEWKEHQLENCYRFLVYFELWWLCKQWPIDDGFDCDDWMPSRVGFQRFTTDTDCLVSNKTNEPRDS